MGSDISFYFSIFLRRFHYFALVAAVVSAAAIAAALLLPTRYYTEALLLVEPPQIPQNLASSTVQASTTAAEQLQIMQEKLLTRSNLIDIANELKVFGDGPRLYPDEVAQRMLAATKFQISVGRDQASLFTIGFESDQPDTAAAVVNAYMTRVLDDNARTRKNQAELTKEYFDQEVARLGADLAAKSAAILEFKNAHIDALPDNLDYQMSRADAVRTRIQDIDRQVVSLQQQRERLILVFNATGGTGNGQLAVSPEVQELNNLRQQLATAVTVYSEQSPKLKSLRSKIAQLEAIVKSQDGDGSAAASNPVSMLDVQLDQIDDQIEQLDAERTQLEGEAERLQKNIEATPTNAITLETLNRDYLNIQNQYNIAIDRAAQAATGERIELSSKGQRIAVINPPVAPRSPSSPNRPLIAIGGVFAGIMMGLAAVVALELLNRSIRRPIDLSKALGIVPIATLPVMRTPGEIARRRATIAGVIAASTAAIVAGIVYLHTQVMPLDLMVDLAVSKLRG